MSTPFGSLGVSASGMTTMKTWIDALADNVANVNTAHRTSEDAYHTKYVVAQSIAGADGGVGGGVRVAAIEQSNGDGRLVYEPGNPLADKDGIVKYPDMELSDQMTHLIVAQRAYSANVTAFERARDAYAQALEIGK